MKYKTMSIDSELHAKIRIEGFKKGGSVTDFMKEVMEIYFNYKKIKKEFATRKIVVDDVLDEISNYYFNSFDSEQSPQKTNTCPDCSSDPCKCPDWVKNKPEDCPDCGNDPCVCDWKVNPVEELPESTENDIFGGVEEGISGRKDKILGAVEFDGGEE